MNLPIRRLGLLVMEVVLKQRFLKVLCKLIGRIKLERIKLFQNLDSRKKISIDIYEQLHKRKVSSNINNNQGIIKLKNIDKGEFTEGLRNYFKY